MYTKLAFKKKNVPVLDTTVKISLTSVLHYRLIQKVSFYTLRNYNKHDFKHLKHTEDAGYVYIFNIKTRVTLDKVLAI